MMVASTLGSTSTLENGYLIDMSRCMCVCWLVSLLSSKEQLKGEKICFGPPFKRTRPSCQGRHGGRRAGPLVTFYVQEAEWWSGNGTWLLKPQNSPRTHSLQQGFTFKRAHGLLKQCSHLGTKCSNRWVWKGHCTCNPQQILIYLSLNVSLASEFYQKQ